MLRRISLVLVLCGFLGAWLGGAEAGAPSAQAQPLAGAFTSCAAQAQIPQIECEALVALYNGTNGAGWTDKTSWLESDEPCGWFGVTCAAGLPVQHPVDLDADSLHQ